MKKKAIEEKMGDKSEIDIDIVASIGPDVHFLADGRIVKLDKEGKMTDITQQEAKAIIKSYKQ